MRILHVLCLLVSVISLSACQTTQQSKDYSHFREVDPRSILIVPVVNETVELTAPDYFLSSISIPVAERGYYVFPVHLVKRVMEDDGLSDADMVHAAPTERLAEMFGADSVMYVRIKQWTSQYLLVRTDTTVSMEYVLKDGETGETIWKDEQTMVYSPNGSAGDPLGLLVQMAIAAAERLAPNYMPLAHQANTIAMTTKRSGLPGGPYSKRYGKDANDFPSKISQTAEQDVREKAAAQQAADQAAGQQETAAEKVGQSL
jgi:hypothetical protein